MSFKKLLDVIMDPTRSLKKFSKYDLESTLSIYVKALLLSGFLAGITSFVWALIRAFYLDLKGVYINYWHLMNYYSSIAVGTFFFYLFAGTVLLFMLSLVMKIFFKTKIANIVALLCFSTAPLIVFSWVYPKLTLALLIWSGVIFITGKKFFIR